MHVFAFSFFFFSFSLRVFLHFLCFLLHFLWVVLEFSLRLLRVLVVGTRSWPYLLKRFRRIARADIF